MTKLTKYMPSAAQAFSADMEALQKVTATVEELGTAMTDAAYLININSVSAEAYETSLEFMGIPVTASVESVKDTLKNLWTKMMEFLKKIWNFFIKNEAKIIQVADNSKKELVVIDKLEGKKPEGSDKPFKAPEAEDISPTASEISAISKYSVLTNADFRKKVLKTVDEETTRLEKLVNAVNGYHGGSTDQIAALIESSKELTNTQFAQFFTSATMNSCCGQEKVMENTKKVLGSGSPKELAKLLGGLFDSSKDITAFTKDLSKYESKLSAIMKIIDTDKYFDNIDEVEKGGVKSRDMTMYATEERLNAITSLIQSMTNSAAGFISLDKIFKKYKNTASKEFMDRESFDKLMSSGETLTL